MLKIEKTGAFGGNTVKTVSSIIDEIDFQPAYQRYGNVWAIEKRQLLIDSIINGYDLPKFYFHYITDYSSEMNTSGKPYAIIDGKQRLQAIKDFIENRLKLSRSFVYEKDTKIDLTNLTYKEIGINYPDIKYDIDNFELDIVYVITDEIEKIEELFYRLNEGKPLNSAEKRNRIVGYLNNSIKEIINNNDFFTSKFIYTNTRLQYEDLCLKLIIIEYEQNLVSFTKTKLDKFVNENRTQNEKLRIVLDRFRKKLQLLNNIFIDNDKLLKSRSLIPVYYYFITNLESKTDLIRPFLIRFNDILIENRKSEKPNPILNEFDLQNQQATHTEKSLNYRFYVLDKFYEKYIENEMNVNSNIN